MLRAARVPRKRRIPQHLHTGPNIKQVDVLGQSLFVHLLQRRDVIQDIHAAPMGRDYKIAVSGMYQQVVDANDGQAGHETLPLGAPVQGYVEAELSPDEE